MFSYCGFASALLVAILLMQPALSADAVGQAHTDGRSWDYDIPSQSLGEALRQLAEQSGLQLFFDDAIVAGKYSIAVRGDFSALEATSRMLKGTGLTFQFLDHTTLVITVVAVADSDGPPVSRTPQTLEGSIGEIVVTGRKQQERLQDVPLSIAALTAPGIEAKLITDLRDVSEAVPGLEFLQSATREFERPVIRGQATILAATESGVSTFVDGLSFNSAISTISLADIERIEVIKGPQSALYGRNTYAGAISITSKLPGDDRNAKIGVRAGQYEEYDVTAEISGPLIERTLNAGVYLRHYTFGGEYRNEFDESRVGKEQSDSVSLVASYTPSESARVVARLNYGRDDDGSPAMYLTPDSIKNIGLEQNGDSVAEFYQGVVPVFPVNFDAEFVDDPGFEQQRYWASVRAEWDISGSVEFVSITGFEDSEQTIRQDSDLLPQSIFLPTRLVSVSPDPGSDLVAQATFGQLDNYQNQQTWQQEFRLMHDSRGVLRTMMGAYFYNDTFEGARLAEPTRELQSQQYQDALADLSAVVSPRTISQVQPPFDRRRIISRDTRNWAIFGKADWDLNDTLTLTAEARYQEESLRYSVFEYVQDDVIARGEDKFRSFVPRLTLRYSPRHNHMFYFVAANGTKPGGVNDDGGFDPLVNSPTFDEEEIWSFEVGSKNSFRDGRLILNTAAYYNKIKDLQITESVVQSDSTADTVIVNRGEVDIWGIEFQASHSFRRIEGLGIQAAFAYNDSRLGREVTQSDQGILDDILDDGIQNCSLGDVDPRPERCKSIATSVGGNRLPRSSKYQLTAGVGYERPFSEGYDWFVRADYSYSSPQYVSAVNIAEYGEASLLNMSLGLDSERFKASIWVKNLTDERSALSVINFINLSSFENTLYGNLRPGRQFGTSLFVRF